MKQSFSSRETSSRGQALAILGVLLFCIPLISSGLRRADFDGRSPAMRDAELASAGDHEFILTWQGSRLGDPRTAVLRQKLLGELAADGLLRGGSPYVKDVVAAGEVLAGMTTGDMPIEKASESLAGIWLGKGGLKVRATANGRRDLEWTARRIEAELNTTPDRRVSVVVRQRTTPIGGDAVTVVAIPDYDLEVFCASAGDPLAVPDSLREEVLKVRGYPTSNEPDGQRLAEDAFLAVGTPVAVRVRLSDAGRAEPLAASTAIREAAVGAGIAAEDLLLTGSLLSSTEHANSLREAVWSASSGQVFQGVLSPLAAAFVLAAGVGLVLGGFSIDLLTSIVLGAFGAAAMAAGMNALGVAWTESLLLMPVITFVLTIATTLLEPAAGGSLSARVRKPMSAATMLCALCLVTLLVGSNMQRITDRQLTLAGAAACGMAWLLSMVCVPPLASLLGPRSIRRATHGLDFAEWIVAHHRITATAAAGIGIAAGMILLQPAVQNWVACPAIETSKSSQYQIERALAGTTGLKAEIHFNTENTQRLRFLERADIVRAATAKLKACRGVTGAMSLAEAAPEVARPGDDAKVRERNAYIVRSNKVGEQLRAQNERMGGSWLAADAGSNEEVLSGETWVIEASVAHLTATSPEAIVGELHRAVQDVLRFHAGVSHRLSGDLVMAASYSASPSRRPVVMGMLAVLSLIVAATGTGSLGRGLAISGLVSLPVLAVLILPGFHPEQFGPAAFLALAIPVSLGVLSCVRLVNDLGEWAAATSTRQEAIAFALSGSTTRSRQALMTMLACFAGLSILTPEIVPAAVRAGVLATTWSVITSLAVFPLLLSGRLGRLIVRDAERVSDAADGHLVAAPIRMEPVVEAPHFELEAARRRVRNAG